MPPPAPQAYVWLALVALVALCVSGAVHPEAASAQGEPLTNDAMQLLELSGLNTSEVLRLLGEPDRQTESAGAANWSYGSATIYFANGTVAAWTGADELNQRRARHQYVTDKVAPAEEGYEEGVVSDWRPEANVSSEQVISDIVGETEVSKSTVEDVPAPAAALEAAPSRAPMVSSPLSAASGNGK